MKIKKRMNNAHTIHSFLISYIIMIHNYFLIVYHYMFVT